MLQHNTFIQKFFRTNFIKTHTFTISESFPKAPKAYKKNQEYSNHYTAGGYVSTAVTLLV